jgi:hypothetical protein
MATVARRDLEAALFGADYPATKRDLMELAEEHLAHDDVISAIASLPPVEYLSFAEVVRSVQPRVTNAPPPRDGRDPTPLTPMEEALEENRFQHP